jgi:hypothetical protein
MFSSWFCVRLLCLWLMLSIFDSVGFLWCCPTWLRSLTYLPLLAKYDFLYLHIIDYSLCYYFLVFPIFVLFYCIIKRTYKFACLPDHKVEMRSRYFGFLRDYIITLQSLNRELSLFVFLILYNYMLSIIHFNYVLIFPIFLLFYCMIKTLFT